MSETNRAAVEALLGKARTALSDAHLLVERGSPEAAINRSYYAAFSAARAALQIRGESPSTHAGVIRRFGYHYVRSGRISQAIGEILTVAETMRNRADYEAFTTFDHEAASDLAADTRRFVEAVETLCEQELDA
jgi:hypothetical protein